MTRSRDGTRGGGVDARGCCLAPFPGKNVALLFFDSGAVLAAEPGSDGDQEGIEGESVPEPGCGAARLAAGEFHRFGVLGVFLFCGPFLGFVMRGR